MAEARQKPLDEVLFGPKLDRFLQPGTDLAEVISACYRTWAAKQSRATSQKSTARDIGQYSDRKK